VLRVFIFLFVITFQGFCQGFYQDNSTYLSWLRHSSIEFHDVDNDNDLDLLMTGYNTGFSNISTRLYKNDGDGEFNSVSTPSITDFAYADIIFGDIDNDNDSDLLITGYKEWFHSTHLFVKDTVGNFISQASGMIGGANGSIDVSDVDNDGDLDVFVTGFSNTELVDSRLYLNDGTGVFTQSQFGFFTDVGYSSVEFADVDGDGDEDLFLAGSQNNYIYDEIAQLYLNDGTGIFSEDTLNSFEAFYNGDIAFADIDNDDDLDLFITGKLTPKLYQNDGSGNFSLITGTSFIGAIRGSADFGDIDNDGDLDLIICGEDYYQSYEKKSILYSNDGLGNFTLLDDSTFVGVSYGDVSFADINNDCDLDLVITGEGNSNQAVGGLYLNIPTDNIISCGKYTWIDGITYLSSNNSAEYIIPDTMGCDSIVKLNLTVIDIDTTITWDGFNIVSNENNAEYRWLDCNNNSVGLGVESQEFSPSSNGVYAVEITKNSCIDTSVCMVISNVGIKDNSGVKIVSVYPNPNSGIVNINFGDLINSTVKVFDIVGQKVYQKSNIESMEIQFELNQPQGVYILQVISTEYVEEFKIIVK